jgi:hypothetical protein
MKKKIKSTNDKTSDKKLNISGVKPRYQWAYVGSDRVTLTWKDYDIIDTHEDKVIESHNSPIMIKHRLRELNNVV